MCCVLGIPETVNSVQLKRPRFSGHFIVRLIWKKKNIILKKVKIILMFKQTVQVVTTGLLSFNNAFES